MPSRKPPAAVPETEERPTEYWVRVDEDDLVDLSVGVVPATVRGMARTMLDWVDTDRRNAERGDQEHRRRVRG